MLDPEKKTDGPGRAAGAAHWQKDALVASEKQQTSPVPPPACFKSACWLAVAVRCFQSNWKWKASFKRNQANSWEAREDRQQRDAGEDQQSQPRLHTGGEWQQSRQAKEDRQQNRQAEQDQPRRDAREDWYEFEAPEVESSRP